MTVYNEAQPVAEVLCRVASELTDLSQSVEQLHSLVECIDRRCIAQQHDFLHAAQSIDIVGQRLSNLAHFMSELSELVPPEWEVRGYAAAQKLKLAALATRLSSREALAVADSGGESEFF